MGHEGQTLLPQKVEGKMLLFRTFMTTKTILLVIADPQALADVAQALGPEWMPTPVRTEPEAVSLLKRYSFNALLVDFNLGSPDASEFVNLALEQHPETARFLLAYEADLALVAAKVNGNCGLLPKPMELDSLKQRIEEGVAEKDAKGEPIEAGAAGSAAPKVPAVYGEVLKVLEEPGASAGQVGEVIARDEGLSAEVLRLAGSSYLGLPRELTDPADAVESLGLLAVKTLVMSRRYLAEHSHLRPGYMSFAELWEHSTQVAQIARDLTLFETKDRALAAEAFAAGLIHDMGKVVLVTNFDDLYGRVHSLARNQPVALWEIEKEMFGATHGEIGGCLVGMWNLPLSVVEAAASHHAPSEGQPQPGFTPLAAVHIANVLEHQLRPSEHFQVAPTIDSQFLNSLGLLARLPVWRAAFANRDADGSGFEPGLEAGNEEALARSSTGSTAGWTDKTPNEDATPTRTATTRPGRRGEQTPASKSRWVFAGVAGAAVVLLAAVWLNSQLGFNTSTPVRARDALVASAPTPTPSVSPVAPDKPEFAVQAPAPSESVVSQPKPEPEPPLAGTNSVGGRDVPATVTDLPPSTTTPPVVAAKKAPEFRLNGITYRAGSPSAIVNGATVYVGDDVNGATVVAIGPRKVTLQVRGQNKILALE
jgi:HD-like signal output (HDOD) protein